MAGVIDAAIRTFVAVLNRPYWERPNDKWLIRRWPDLGGGVAATIFFWLSLTPSLVPRSWLLQGIVGGITAAFGYGVGVVLAWLIRLITRRSVCERFRARAWLFFFILTPALSVLLLGESDRMQRELRRLQGLEPEFAWSASLIGVLALLVWAVLVVLARTVRLGTRNTVEILNRTFHRRIAELLGLLLVTVLVFGVVRGVVYDSLITAADRAAAAANLGTRPGLERPTSPLVSGGPGSFVDWEDLGAQGRNFTGSVPTAAAITEFTDAPASDPIRVYVGGTESRTFTKEADLAVKELERTGAFQRDVIAVVGTTGSGWVDPEMIRPLEYMYGGRTATVALQYSYLPSWISFLADRERAATSTAALFNAVREKLDSYPEADRPLLVVAGESLGSYGVEAAFGTLDRLTSHTDGALLLGPPNVNPIWNEVTKNRDRGSPIWRPIYQNGRTVRFAQYPRDLDRPTGSWGHPRVVYFQNASDPVVWWSPDLLFERPEWLTEPLGPDVSPDVAWFPLVTFWQATVDLVFANTPPPPHGHRYGTNPVAGWAAVIAPPGWTAADTARLSEWLTDLPVGY